MQRDEVQYIASQTFLKHKKGILHISMGVGKTKIGIDILDKEKKTLIAAPYKSIIKSWKEEFKKWNKSDKNVTYTTTTSLYKHSEKLFDLIILDEIHLYSENQLKKVPKGNILGLSGTLSYTTAEFIRSILNLEIIFSYTLEEAIKDNIIADYNIKIINLTLDNKDKYIKSGTQLNPFYTTEQLQYDYYTNQFNQIKSLEWNSYGSQKKKYTISKMQIASKRAKLIYSCKTKIEAAKKIIELQYNNRLLIFTTLTETANQLAEHQYHSKSDKNNLELFSSGKIDKLAVVNMANVGLNIKPLNKAIIHQFQSSEETAQQRIGRILRLEYNNPNKKAEIWVIRIINTVDEDWVNSALRNIPQNKIEYINFKDI